LACIPARLEEPELKSGLLSRSRSILYSDVKEKEAEDCIHELKTPLTPKSPKVPLTPKTPKAPVFEEPEGTLGQLPSSEAQEEYLVLTPNEENVFVLLVGKTRLRTADILTFRSPATCLDCGPKPPRQQGDSLQDTERALVLIGFERGHAVVVNVGASHSKVLEAHGSYSPEEGSEDLRSSVTAVRWVPGSSDKFVTAHSSGSLYFWDRTRTSSSQLVCPKPTRSKKKKNDLKQASENVALCDSSNDPSDSSISQRHIFFERNEEDHNPAWAWFPGGAKRFANLRKGITDIRFSPTQPQHLALSSLDGTLQILNFLQFEIIFCFESWFGAFLCVAWSKDGTCIATGGEDDAICVWNLKKDESQASSTSKNNMTFEDESDQIPPSLLASPASPSRISSFRNSPFFINSPTHLKEHNIPVKEQIYTSKLLYHQRIFRGEAHQNWVRCIQFDNFFQQSPSPENDSPSQEKPAHRLVSIAEDGTIAIWDIEWPNLTNAPVKRRVQPPPSANDSEKPEVSSRKSNFSRRSITSHDVGSWVCCSAGDRITRRETRPAKKLCCKPCYQLPGLSVLICRTGVITLGEPSLVKFWRRIDIPEPLTSGPETVTPLEITSPGHQPEISGEPSVVQPGKEGSPPSTQNDKKEAFPLSPEKIKALVLKQDSVRSWACTDMHTFRSMSCEPDALSRTNTSPLQTARHKSEPCTPASQIVNSSVPEGKTQNLNGDRKSKNWDKRTSATDEIPANNIPSPSKGSRVSLGCLNSSQQINPERGSATKPSNSTPSSWRRWPGGPNKPSSISPGK